MVLYSVPDGPRIDTFQQVQHEARIVLSEPLECNTSISLELLFKQCQLCAIFG